MKSVWMTFVCAALTIGTAEAKTVAELTSKGSAEDKGRAIAAELDARNAGYRDLTGEVEMVLRDPSGSEAKRRFSIKVLEQPDPAVGDYSLIVFDNPTDVKGTALLSHGKASGEDDQWLYLPALGRVKRISSANRTGSFVGSEFAYEDLTGNDTAKSSWRLLGQKACGKLSCLELEATPKDSGSGYSRRVLTVDDGEFRILSVDFFDRKGARIKTLAYDGYKKVNDRYWRAQAWTMKNHQSGKTTSLTFTSMRMGTGLRAADFSSEKLRSAR
jgi:outer membrane lipoprotein-sorting protein